MNKEIKSLRRFPAEWERQGGVIVAWPHEDTDWNYMLEEVRACFREIIRTIARYEKVIVIVPDLESVEGVFDDCDNRDRIIFVTIKSNDTWARDFGPITTEDSEGNQVMLDFKFNGWGLKFAADKDNLLTRKMIDSGVLCGKYENHLGFVLEGGSVESDGKGTLLTTSQCLLSLNRNGNLSQSEIENYLKDSLGVSEVLWLDYGALEGDDTDSHIDTLARLAPDDTIVYVGCDDVNDSHFEELSKMKQQLSEMRTFDGKPYNLVELPLPDAVYDEDGERLPATYANFLIMNEAVLMPSYGQPYKDRMASDILKTVFPDREIVMIDCRALIKQHGSLHCVTMQVPEEILPK